MSAFERGVFVVPDLFYHVQQMYLNINSLVFLQKEKPVILTSQQGVHQGYPLGPALFSTAIHPFLMDTQKANPGIRVLAYLDDVFLLGPSSEVLSALENLRAAFLTVHLEIADSKCEIYSPNLEVNRISYMTTIPATNDGTRILGVPIGKPEFVEDACLESAKSRTDLCDKLRDLDDVQSAMLLLRYCHIPRINHLARSLAVLPDRSRPAADLHDFQSRSTFTSLMGCDSVGDSVWLQATLPIKLGGFGLSSVSTISQSAFLASWAHSLHELPARFPDMNSTVQ